MNNYAKIQYSLKELNCLTPSAPLILQVKSKTCFNASILMLNRLNDLAKGGFGPSPLPLVAPRTVT